jgi:hypothetical protein
MEAVSLILAITIVLVGIATNEFLLLLMFMSSLYSHGDTSLMMRMNK